MPNTHHGEVKRSFFLSVSKTPRHRITKSYIFYVELNVSQPFISAEKRVAPGNRKNKHKSFFFLRLHFVLHFSIACFLNIALMA